MTVEEAILTELESGGQINWDEVDSRPLLASCADDEIEAAVASLQGRGEIIVGQETDGRDRFSFSFIALNRSAA